MRLKLEPPFKGQIPLPDPILLPRGAAVTAKNCDLEKGTLRPLKNIVSVATPTKAGTKQAIFLYEGYWFSFLADVDVVLGPVANASKRVYWTGEAEPRVSDLTKALSGGTDYPVDWNTLGVPAPTSAPSINVTGDPPADPAELDTRYYRYTFVTADGEEGPPSPISAQAEVGPDQTADLSALEVAPAGKYNITHKRIYRTNTGSLGTEYQLVAEIIVAQTTYSDSKTGDELGEVLPSEDWIAPPAGLKGLREIPGSMLAGFVDNYVRICVPGQLHAWPLAYEFPVGYPIVGLGVFGLSTLICTTGHPYILTGTDPEAMGKPERVEIFQACTSKRGIVDLGEAVAYPSPDGLVVIGVGINRLATEKVLAREDWQALDPTSIIGAGHNGRYYGFYDDGVNQGGFIFDPKREDLVFHDFYPDAVHTDPETDELYLSIGASIYKWNAGTDLSLEWESAPRDIDKPRNFGWGQVHGAYPITMNLYGDGVLRHTKAVADNKPFRLPLGYLAKRYSVEFTGTGQVESAVFAETMQELREDRG